MGVPKHCGREREKEVERSGAPHRGKSAAMRGNKKEGAGAFQLGKDTGILWKEGNAGECMAARVGMDDREGHSDLYKM